MCFMETAKNMENLDNGEGRFDSSYGDLREYKGNGDDISNGEFSK